MCKSPNENSEILNYIFSSSTNSFPNTDCAVCIIDIFLTKYVKIYGTLSALIELNKISSTVYESLWLVRSGIVYCVFFIPLSFMCWFRPAYKVQIFLKLPNQHKKIHIKGKAQLNRKNGTQESVP